MGKRGGGRRRKRANQWAAGAAVQESSASSSPSFKRQKISPGDDDDDDGDDDVVSSPIISTCTAAVMDAQVSLIGTEGDSPLPPLPEPCSEQDLEQPRQHPSKNISNDDNNNGNNLAATTTTMVDLAFVWNYLASSQKMTSLRWKPSKIQRYLWSILLQSRWNTIGIASTGSGKTLSYAIPTTISGDTVTGTGTTGSILVLVPTRELVQQVAKVYQKVVKALRHYRQTRPPQRQGPPLHEEPLSPTSATTVDIPIITIHGGTSRLPQQEALEEAATTADKCIVIATPGRFLDLLNASEAATARVLPIFSWIVLDEADQLSKEGDLGPQVDEILATTRLPETCVGRDQATRIVLVSATYPDRARRKFQEWVGPQHALVQVDYVRQQPQQQQQQNQQQLQPLDGPIDADDNDGDNDGDAAGSVSESTNPSHRNNHKNNAGVSARIPSHLEQILHVCAEHKKPRKLIHTLQQIYQKQYPNSRRSRPLGIIFFSKIEKLKHVHKLLEKEGITGSVPLHSQLPSAKLRQLHLHQFACGQKPLLLATDVAARGIDIPSVQFVIQYDFPGNLQQYVHRCGRAGRNATNHHDSTTPTTTPTTTTTTTTRTGTTKTTTSSVSTTKSNNQNRPKPTIYSFFTRNLQAMAPDLIQLLEANQAWVDPNLRALAQEVTNGQPQANKKKKMKKNCDQTSLTATTTMDPAKSTVFASKNGDKRPKDAELDAVQVEVDDFPELAPNRILLRRASHVSDASSSSEDENQDHDDDDSLRVSRLD